MIRYVIDTQLYIDAVRSVEGAADLERFYSRYLPVTYLSAVVVMELLAGTRPTDVNALDEGLITPFERRGRIIPPSYNAYRRAGGILEALARSGLELVRAPKSLFADVVLAASCRDEGLTLVTRNRRDFARIAKCARGFRFVGPWPTA